MSKIECRLGKQIENINGRLYNLLPIDSHINNYFTKEVK